MGKMYTLKPDESIHDHMVESFAMLNELANSIGADHFLNSTMIKDIKPDSVRFIIEHIRDTIEMLDELTDDLTEECDYYQDCLHKLANRASNFCGNCANCEQHSNDVYVCKRLHMIIDPDESSCLHFKSNESGKVVIGKPEFPCCEHCSHEDCDDCTLCPF